MLDCNISLVRVQDTYARSFFGVIFLVQDCLLN